MLMIWGCESRESDNSVDKKNAARLAQQHCGSCHAYVPPQALSKKVWESGVLKLMGYRMGIYEGMAPPDSLFEEGRAGELVKQADVYPLTPKLSREEWELIRDYYLTEAPDSMPGPDRKSEIKMGLEHFNYRPSNYSHQPPLTALVKILPDKQAVVFGDGKRNISSLNVIDSNLEKDYEIFMKGTPVHYQILQDTIFLTTIGPKIYPSDAPDGIIQKLFSPEPNTPPKRAVKIIENLQRPVDVEYADLNQDGRTDVLVCEYGHLTGKLAWYENIGGDDYTPHILQKTPGAIKTYVRDVNNDEHPDIIVLMAQGDEGIFLYTNDGTGHFQMKRLLTFSPLNGSSFMDLVDIDGDKDPDIIYTCGDNADQTPVLKKHHGIYIFTNDGKFNFSQSWFFHLNGAYKALVHDFDMDGDQDIAAISFFPDYRKTPEESFVYLQNTGDLQFEAYSAPEVTEGRWIVMDAADFDQDGDRDIALGSFVGFKPAGDSTNLYQKWIDDSPSVAVLENTTIP